MIEKRHFYINGAWVDPIEGTDHNVIDPSNEEPCAVISLGGQADTDAAVAAAKAAFPNWMHTPPEERIALVEKLYDIYKSRTEEMAQAISLEMGAPIDMARQQQVGAGISHIKTFIQFLNQIWNFSRIILQVCIHGNNIITFSQLKSF